MIKIKNLFKTDLNNKTPEDIKPDIFTFIKSMFISFGFLRLLGLGTGNILSLIFFTTGLFLITAVNRLYLKTDPDMFRAASRTSNILALLFTLMICVSDYTKIFAGMENFLFQAVVLVGTFIGLLIIFYYSLMLIYLLTGKLKTYVFLTSPRGCVPHPGLISGIVCFIFYLPYYLYEYPGILTPDSINQMNQVMGRAPFDNKNPLVHTLLINIWVKLGLKIGLDINGATGLYILFQMAFLCLAIGYCISTLKKFNVSNKILIGITAYFALIPYNGALSVTMWKDVIFGALVLIFISVLARLVTKREEANKFDKDVLIFILSGVGFCLFRSNGWFGFLFTVPFLIFYFRKSFKTMFPAIILVVLISAVVKYPVMNSLNIVQSDPVESLCIPIQQITRVLVKDRPITPDQRALIEEVADLTYIHELYEETFADNIKDLIRATDRQDYLVAHKGEYAKLYIELGLKYPKDYIDAYVAQTMGYWYPDIFYPITDTEGISHNSLGLEPDPLLRGFVFVKIREIVMKLHTVIPLFGLLFSLGSVLWIILIMFGYTFVNKDNDSRLLFIPILAMVFTILIATPVSGDFRYVYYEFLALPLLAIMPLKH